jgi:hypothetical protein
MGKKELCFEFPFNPLEEMIFFYLSKRESIMKAIRLGCQFIDIFLDPVFNQDLANHLVHSPA